MIYRLYQRNIDASIKSEMMIRCFKYIEDFIDERSDGTIKPIYSNYVERANSFYNQNSTTWPALCYRLVRHDPSPDKDLIMRIEIDHRLYYGVTNWDDKEKSHPEGTDDVLIQDYIEAHAGACWTAKRTKWWYFWKFLGVDETGLNFRACDNTFDKLFDDAEFEAEMTAACKEIEKFLINWGMI